MPNTPDHKVAMYKLAQERARNGLPVWEHTIRLGGVFHNDDLAFTEKRDAIVDIIKTSSWYQHADTDDPDGIREILDNLAAEDDEDGVDYWWNIVYDLADTDRVWIDTFN